VWLQTLWRAPAGAHDRQPARDFPGILFLPRPSLALEQRLSMSEASYGSLDSTSDRREYRIVLGENVGSDNITLEGSLGRELYEKAATPSEFDDCVASQPYCAWSPYVASSQPTIERFNGLTSLSGRAAVVSHITCCNGENWTVTWYDPELDASYSESFYLGPANRLGAVGVSTSNARIATDLVKGIDELIAVDPSPLRKPIADVAAMAGDWGSHGLYAHVREDGYATISWRIYAWCGDRGVDWNSCDRTDGNQIIPGGFAEVAFDRVQAGTLEGQTIATTNQGTVGFGAISLQPGQFGTAQLISRGQKVATLCGPKYFELAPKSFKDTYPCGA
jgi:hypothetical protein